MSLGIEYTLFLGIVSIILLLCIIVSLWLLIPPIFHHLGYYSPQKWMENKPVKTLKYSALEVGYIWWKVIIGVTMFCTLLYIIGAFVRYAILPLI